MAGKNHFAVYQTADTKDADGYPIFVQLCTEMELSNYVDGLPGTLEYVHAIYNAHDHETDVFFTGFVDLFTN